MTTKPLTILITPQAKSALETEAERAGGSGDITGGLLFGCPVDDRQRLVVSSARPRPEVHFGQKDFCLDQSRTSQQLAQSRNLHPDAHYCGVWYVHRAPNPELADEEWVQAQGVLEDPDYRFKDLICLVICLYSGKLNTYASSFNLYQSARGQLPTPAQLQLTTDLPSAQAQAQAQPVPADWYKSPAVVRRLELERERLAQRYLVEPAVTPDGRVAFRLTPKTGYKDMSFYITCGPGFPDQAPEAFMSLEGDQYPLFSPTMNEWSAEQWLVKVADDLVRWQAQLLGQQVEAAEEALKRGNYQKASDLLVTVLLIDPRKPRAARLLAKARAMMGSK